MLTDEMVFEQEIREACNEYQAGRIDSAAFTERVINARNKLDIARSK